MKDNCEFDLVVFSQLVGCQPNQIPEAAQALLAQYSLTYHLLEGDERQRSLDAVIKYLQTKDLSVSGQHRLPDWERGWAENLHAFKQGGYAPESLIPRYLHPDEVDRLNGQYIRSAIPYFQLRFYDVFRQYLFHRYLAQAHTVYEFGCGTGYNLAILAKLFPEQTIYGLDWAQASVQLIQTISANGFPRLKGQYFDMFHPDSDFNLAPGAVVLTLNAMEQLGSNFDAFVHYLLAQNPSLCVHAEPLLELYQPEDPFDVLAIQYHQQRGYLKGFVPFMQQLAQQGLIEIIQLQRVSIGNQFHEAYSLLIWKPIFVSSEPSLI